MSNVSIGLAFEKKVEAFLIGRGFTVMRTWKKMSRYPDRGKWITITKRQDFFGCIDLIAMSSDRRGTFMIQCTTGDAGPRRKKIETVDWDITSQPILIIRRKPSKREFVIQKYFGRRNGGWTKEMAISLSKKANMQEEATLRHFGI